MGDWTKFTKRISIRATAKQVYEAWTTQANLETWFLRSAVFTTSDGTLRDRDSPVEAGDTYVWHWYGFSDDVKEVNPVKAANGKDLFEFVFTAGCLVRVKLTEHEGETLVELTQDNIPHSDDPDKNLVVGCGEGWTFYLANLKSILEGGIDLRNKNEKIKGVVNS